MAPPAEPLFLLKTGELYLKGGNRHLFEQRLVRSIERVIAARGARVVNHVGKLAVREAGHDAAVLDALTRVFGLVSIEIAFEVPTDPSAIVEQAVLMARDRVDAADGRIGTFRIDARRTWKGFEMDSMELNRRAGAAVVQATGLGVNLGQPDLTIWVEVGRAHTHLYCRRVRAAGGLPVGSSGRAVLLLSGGIDSPVAGWFAMRRGLLVEPVHFHSPPHTGPAAVRKVRDLTRVLATFQGETRLCLVPFTRAQESVRDAVREDYRVVIYRRLMMRVANRLAEASKAGGIVTGESLGQVASQTLENLGCVEAVSDRPVLRPLVTHDKIEVVERARALGTFDISIRAGEDCCSLFVPRHPVTRGREGVCSAEEAKLDVEALVDECVGSTVFETVTATS